VEGGVKTNQPIRWIASHPLDRFIHLSNNLALVLIFNSLNMVIPVEKSGEELLRTNFEGVYVLKLKTH